ncbi:transmembrane 6 superfamily member 2-like isoform X4 [Scleropages formosus]|uniref:Transmembrane 6 superfamily member 2a n=1 Tax=Scleropages formosus TaxID=113540 RepID=A0A8C9RLL9_SCLFO|nr:transmembrane 6 superfamily member 2-like isoform X4 [Scleropages formosus]
MNLPQEICVFFFSMSALGVLYVMNNIAAFQEPLAILAIGAALSGAVVLLAFLSVRHRPPKDLLFYLCVEFSFASVMKLTSALEQDGFTRGFTEFYQRTGEPYMVTAYAIMMCYWDGVVHFLLYLLLLRRMSRTAPYRSAGLFWAGSCFASMAVFIPGTVIGKYGSSTHPASWLNGRFLLGAAWAGLSLLRRPRELPPVAVDVAEREQRKGVLSRPVDLLLTLLLLAAMAFSAFRGLVVLDCPLDSCFTYIYGYEPYLKDPVGYPRLTMLLFLFYGLPLMAAFVYGLWTPGCAWMLDWTVLFAGAVAQAQWCHIGASLHMRTPYTYRTPEETWWPVVLVNLLYTATPLLLAYRCVRRPAFFVKSVPQGEATQAKKND